MGVESLNILLDPEGKMLLSELDKGIIENIRTNTISSQLKNQELSGVPTAGLVYARRFANAVGKNYGTARAAGKGDSLKGKKVEIPIDQDKEYIEELEEKDIALLGVSGLLNSRSDNQKLVMVADLDTKFFAEAENAGTAYTAPSTANTIPKILENSIVTLSTIKTDYVTGVPRSLINIVASEEYYSEIRDELDHISNTGITTQMGDFGKYHDVPVFHSSNLPDTVNFITMIKGAIAQPVMVKPYKAEKIPLSEAFAVELFVYYGTKAVTPELILVNKAA